MRIVLAVVVAFLLGVVVVAALDYRPGSFRSQYRREVADLLTRPIVAGIVTEGDLAPLPPLMQTYLRRVGAVGRPHVRNVHITFDAQMRSAADSPWMQATVDQYEFFDTPARFFFMQARRSGIPVDAFHRYVGDSATFRVRIMGLYPMVDFKGDTLTQSETVTLLNDILVFAPAAVLDLPFGWEMTGDRTLRATFTNGGHRVSAELTFDAAGDLVGFRSNDRYAAKGKESVLLPWSTPISDYGEVDGVRLGRHGDANWVENGAEWTYGRFTVRSVAHNVR
jgi:hypothetical protein